MKNVLHLVYNTNLHLETVEMPGIKKKLKTMRLT